jgi:cellulose synthase/poly-beta-1,6-N-acetylglucosamine synthase-like glycosyltransferase
MDLSTVLLIATGFGVAGIVLGAVGHPLLVIALACVRRGAAPGAAPLPEPLPTVSVIVPVHADARELRHKCLALLDGDYPRDRLEILVAADGPVAGLDTALANPVGEAVRLLRMPRRGKPDVLNDAAAHASGELIVISDRDAIPASDCLTHLVAAFADASVGGACGHVGIAGKGSQRAYWVAENRLRRAEVAALGNLTSNSGALTALRRELWRDIPKDAADDLFIALSIFLQGRRFVFADAARVTLPPRAQDLAGAVARQARITVQSLNTQWHCRAALDPFRSGWFAVALIFHKLLRRLFLVFVGFALAGLAGLAALAGQGAWIAAAGLVAALGLGVARLLPDVRLARKGLWFLAAQAGMALGVWRFLRGGRVNSW